MYKDANKLHDEALRRSLQIPQELRTFDVETRGSVVLAAFKQVKLTISIQEAEFIKDVKAASIQLLPGDRPPSFLSLQTPSIGKTVYHATSLLLAPSQNPVVLHLTFEIVSTKEEVENHWRVSQISQVMDLKEQGEVVNTFSNFRADSI